MAANEMTPHFVRITGVEKNTPDVFTLTLETDEFSYLPGQFNMLYAFGAGEAAISISGANSNEIIHTIRNVGSVTGQLAKLKVGDPIGVRGPFGRAWPLPKRKDLVIVAGGIGLAPLRPVIRHIEKNRKDYGQIHVIYGARQPKDLLYAQEIQEWKKSMDITVTVDSADESWQGHVGVVTTFIERLKVIPKKTVALICGPEVMMRFAARELIKKEISEKNIYVSMERNMKCALAQCGRCQLGPHFVCKDGPVFSLPQLKNLWIVREM
jgi:NAD(P)H-flavin reductase